MNCQLDVTEVTVSVVVKLARLVTVSEACKRHACDVLARHTDLTEEATQRGADRRAAPTEGGKVTVLKSKVIKRFSAA